jgi:hypothetical protein
VRASIAGKLAVAAGLAFLAASCATPPPVVYAGEDLPRPETLKIEQQILAWAPKFFAEPSSITSARISAPVPYVFGPARAWLVCIEYDTRERGGTYIGRRRLAIGIGPGTFYPPLGRGANTVPNGICDTLPLSWRPFPALERIGLPTRR